MSILLPVVLSGLAGVVVAETRTSVSTSPLQAFAISKTKRLSTANPPFPVQFSFDEPSNTLRATAILPQVFPRLKSRLLADTLMADYAQAMSQDTDLAALAKKGVAVEYALVDINRTPICTVKPEDMLDSPDRPT